MIPYGRQNINDDDIAAVVDVLQSDFLTQGPKVPEFESAIAKYCGVDHAVAVNSGTSALHIACLALGLGEGDWLWTSPNSFVASANCALYCGAEVDFVDIDEYGNMCASTLAEKLKQAERDGRLPKIVVPVDFSGHSCAMVEIHRLAQQYGFKIIEDASHAVGAEYLGRPVGSCEYSDITIFSFHPVKLITTGEGGMALCKDASYAQAMMQLRSHGITRDQQVMESIDAGPWYYEQQQLGFNYRMTDIAAALGLTQLARLSEFIIKRRELRSLYDQFLADLPLSLPRESSDVRSSWHLYVVRLNLDAIERTRREVFESLRTKGIGVNVHYIPIYQQPYFRKIFGSSYDLPNMRQYYEGALTIPLHPQMTESDVEKVVLALKDSVL